MFFSSDIILTEGPEWKERRRFALQHLKNHGLGKSRMEAIVLDEIQYACESLATEEHRRIKINSYFFVAFLNVVWVIVAGN